VIVNIYYSINPDFSRLNDNIYRDTAEILISTPIILGEEIKNF